MYASSTEGPAHFKVLAAPINNPANRPAKGDQFNMPGLQSTLELRFSQSYILLCLPYSGYSRLLLLTETIALPTRRSPRRV